MVIKDTVRVKKTYILYVIYMMLITNVYLSVFSTSHYLKLFTAFGLVGAASIVYKYIRERKIDEVFLEGTKAFLLPMTVITLLAAVTSVVIHHTTNKSDIIQSIIKMFRYWESFIIAFYSVKWFGKKSITLIVISSFISYLTVIIKYIIAGGNLINFSNVSVAGITLESQIPTYTMGMIIIYLLLSVKPETKGEKKEKRALIIICVIMIYFGNKRLLYIALAASFAIYFIFKGCKSKKMRILKIVFFLYIIFAFVYLIIIKNNILDMLFEQYGINDNSRLKFWNYFSYAYEISPLYFGRGISYTDNIMVLPETLGDLYISQNVPIHNDILRAYIGWGFIPFLYYFYNFFIIVLKRFIKHDLQLNAWKYFALASCYFFINMMDNMLTDYNFNIVFFVIWLLLMQNDNDNIIKTGFNKIVIKEYCNE